MDRRCTLLLVEDEDVLRMLMVQFLEAEGFDVHQAADGAEGVARFAAEGPFDLMLVDLNLPHLSGVEVCRRVRKLAPDQPIVVCSAAISAEAEQNLRSVGVDQMMTKPYHPEALVALIRRAIARPTSAHRVAPTPLLSPVGAF